MKNTEYREAIQRRLFTPLALLLGHVLVDVADSLALVRLRLSLRSHIAENWPTCSLSCPDTMIVVFFTTSTLIPFGMGISTGWLYPRDNVSVFPLSAAL